MVHSLWPIFERNATTMFSPLEHIYRVWPEFEEPLGFANTSRTPLWTSALDVGPRLPRIRHMSPIVCSGPCFHSRFAWKPSVCSSCWYTRDDDDSASSDSDDGFGSLSSSEYKAYRRQLYQYVIIWHTRCLKKVGKRGHWTSRVLNDK